MNDPLWSAVEIDGRSRKIQIYNRLPFKVKDGKPFIEVPDHGLIKTPTGWLLLPQGMVPRSVFLERVLSLIAFFPYEKADRACQRQAVWAYLQRMKEKSEKLQQELNQVDELIEFFDKGSQQ